MLVILELRSIGYYKIKHGVLQQNLSKYVRYFRLESADVPSGQFNRKKKTDHNYPWLVKMMKGETYRVEILKNICRFRKIMPVRCRKERGDGHIIQI